MLVTKVRVGLPRGLQARNTASFVSKACTLDCEVIISKSGVSADGKELMKVMDLHVEYGDEVMLMVNGHDEQVTLTVLRNFLLNLNK